MTLLLGLVLFALAIAMMIRSELGLGPWDAFHVGLSRITGLSVGAASIVTGLAIVLAGLFLNIRPGVGTLVNMILIGVVIDLLLPFIPSAEGFAAGLAYYLPAIAVCGIATGMYISAGLGQGPRDGLMIGLSRKSGWPVSIVRALIEMLALLSGWLMGGKIGFGTMLFAVLIGPAVQWGLRMFGVAAHQKS